MKKILFLLITAMLFLASCRSEADKGRTMWKAYLNKVLIAPQTLNIISEQYKQSENSSKVNWTIEYSCETAGGMNKRCTLHCYTWIDEFYNTDNGEKLSRDELKPYMK